VGFFGCITAEEETMFPVEGQDLLRVALLAGILGFATFCLSYTLYVWHRRNASLRAPMPRLPE
jgi:hypothetical protein